MLLGGGRGGGGVLKFYSSDRCMVFTLSCHSRDQIMVRLCARFRTSKVLKECCVEEMDEEELIEVVRKPFCLWEVSSSCLCEVASRSLRTRIFNLLMGVVYYWV